MSTPATDDGDALKAEVDKITALLIDGGATLSVTSAKAMILLAFTALVAESVAEDDISVFCKHAWATIDTEMKRLKEAIVNYKRPKGVTIH